MLGSKDKADNGCWYTYQLCKDGLVLYEFYHGAERFDRDKCSMDEMHERFVRCLERKQMSLELDQPQARVTIFSAG